MRTTNELLDAAKARHGITSDYKLAQVLQVAKSAVMNYRSGRSHPDDRVCERLADLTGEDAGELAVWMQVERARDEQTRSMWVGVADRLQRAGLAAVSAVLALWIGGGPDAGAQAATRVSGQSAPVHIASDSSIHWRG